MIARTMIVGTMLLFSVPFIAPLEAVKQASEPRQRAKPFQERNDTIRILLAQDKSGAVLEVKGRYKLYDPNTKELIGTRFVGKRKYVQSVSDGLKWGEEFPGIYQLVIVPDHPETTTLIDGIEYKGTMYVYDVAGSISIVNELSFDEYLRETLADKIDSTLPEEALAAYVIAARTNALYQKEMSPSKFWAVDASKIGYEGHAVTKVSDAFEKTLEATHNMVMNVKSSLGNVSSFPVQWSKMNSMTDQAVQAKISLQQAADLAERGEHAAEILKKAFPNISIKLVKE